MAQLDLNKIVCMTVLVVCSLLGQAQDPVTLQFSGKDQFGHHVPLSTVTMENVTKHWQEMLYYPDTTLFIGQTGIEEIEQFSDGVRLFQNVPNPFDGVTDFVLYLPEASAVTLEIHDLNSKVAATYQGSLDPGSHLFRSWLTSPQTYLLNARTDGGTIQIKMVNTGRAGQNRLEYLGKGSISPMEKAEGDTKGSTNLPFSSGDLMLYKGYAHVEGTQYECAPVERQQYTSELIPLTFTLPQPPFYCGIDSVTDFDGNAYSTVEIGQQCWMKENLHTTHYADGTEIPIGTTISDNTAYRYYPNDSSSNVPIYGYLYNWTAVMHGAAGSNANPSGVQGICPLGWHLPSYTEIEQLLNFVGNQIQYVCGGEFNNYIGKALAIDTGWFDSEVYCAVGTNQETNNATGFSALPSGAFDGIAYGLGSLATFFSSTEDFTGNNLCAYAFRLSSQSPEACIYSFLQRYGYSVRCLRD